MFSSSSIWIGDMRKIPCVKIKLVQSRVFHLLQMDKVERLFIIFSTIFISTILSKLEFLGAISVNELQFDRFANGGTAQPFADATMELRQRSTRRLRQPRRLAAFGDHSRRLSQIYGL